LSNGSDELPPGTVLQRRYVIQYRAGGGGMGTVYNAIDTRIAGRVVAVKEMKQVDRDGKQLVGEELEKARKRFQREAVLLSGLQHDHIPRVYDFFESQGRAYLVMDWIDGETLLEHLNHLRGAMPAQQVLWYALQLCDALAYLHARYEPIIFRDLKPANIMVRPDEHIFLIDFGIARSFKAGQKDDTEKFLVRGFGAPEMLGFVQTDARADLFSLGATMHYCLTRQVPDYLEHSKSFPSTRDYNRSVPVELDTLILELVQYNPDDRPPNIGEIEQQFDQIYQELAASRAGNPQTATVTSPLYDPSFYSAETERGGVNEVIRPVQGGANQMARPRQPIPAQHPFVPPPPPAPPATRAPIEVMLGLLSSGWQLLARTIIAKTRSAGAVIFSTDVRQSFYYRYLFVRAKLNATGLWTGRFLLFLLAMLIGGIALSALVYSHAGQSYYRAEFALVFVLLIVAVVAGGRLRNLTARHMMLSAGCLIAVAFLALLVSPGFAGISQGADATGQATTLNLLLSYGTVTLALIALIGSAGSKISAAQSRVFARCGHIAMAGVAVICIFMQYSFGELEHVIFLPSNARPFAVAMPSSPPISTNVIALAILGFIAICSLVRMSRPFGRFLRFLLLLLCLAFVPVQFTFGLTRLGLVFPQASSPTLVLLNLVIFFVPLLLAFLTFPALPDRMAWVAYLPLLTLSLGVAFMQVSLGNAEPFPFLSTQPQALGSNFAYIAAFGQVIVFCLIAAGAVFFFRSITTLATRRNSASNLSVTQGATVAIQTIKLPGAGDRLALTVVALGCGLVQWSFWSGTLQHALQFNYTQQGDTLLYAPYLGLIFTAIAIGGALLALAFVLAHTLFFPERSYPWLRTVLIACDRITTLCLAGITLELLFTFGARGGWLAGSVDTAQMLPTPSVPYNYITIGLIALFLFVALALWKRPFGWFERALLLFCCIATIVMLSDTRDVQALPLLSASLQSTQSASGALSSVSINRLVALCLLLSSLLSLLWVARTKITSDRVVLCGIFLIAALFAGLHTLSPHHILFLIALLLEIQGLLIAFKIERVRNGI
jgi:serine/threonine protein kinase